jgi:hypothetical protein
MARRSCSRLTGELRKTRPFRSQEHVGAIADTRALFRGEGVGIDGC